MAIDSLRPVVGEADLLLAKLKNSAEEENPGGRLKHKWTLGWGDISPEAGIKKSGFFTLLAGPAAGSAARQVTNE